MLLNAKALMGSLLISPLESGGVVALVWIAK
jgi:hypothetical protein